MSKSHGWTRRASFAVLGAIGALATGWPTLALSADSDDTGYLQQLYQRAQQAGQKDIIVYAASSADNRPLYDAFEKLYPPIKVKSIDLFGPPLQARLLAEFSSTGPQVDLLATGEPDLLNFKKNGWLQPFLPETAKGIPSQLIGADNLWIGYATLVLGVLVNTNLVAEADMPKSWKDLVSSAWKGKIAVSNPGAINGLSQALAAALKAGVIDQTWLQQLAANKPFITPGAVAALQMVATGQAGMSPAIARTQFLTAKKQGAPLAFIIPTEGYTALPAPFALVAKAPHAEAAKLLEAWIMTPNAQKLLAETGQPGTMPGAPPLPGLPPGTQRFILDWKYLQDNYPAHLQSFKALFGT